MGEAAGMGEWEGPAGVAIRRAQAQDLPALTELTRELDAFQRGWRVFTPRPSFERDLAAKFRNSLVDGRALVVVAKDGEEVVGMAVGHVHVPSSVSDDRAVEVSSVIVRPSHRGRGIGRALTGAVARFAQEQGIHKLTLRTFSANEGALAFWQAMGFEPRLVQLTADVGAVERTADPRRAEPD
jgi:ribosomal protein S18 acetylase RimI-like enzyme